MPQMMLIARNRIHPRELTYLPYETRPNEIPGWRPPSPLAVRQLRVARNVIIRRTELELQRGEPLEVVADRQLFCHPHSAVKLHRLLTDESGRPADRRLGRR